MNPIKTYWHLQALGRKPDEYDIGTSKLLYHPTRGFELEVPMQAWCRQHLLGGALRCSDWEAFEDPRRTTYRAYAALQAGQESFVDGLLEAMQEPSYATSLSASWRMQLAQTLPVLRFPVHAFQLVSAYLAQLAPSSRLLVISLFQSADEMRRVQRFAQRSAQLGVPSAELARLSRASWETDARWQPWRALVEQLLVTYEWSEAFVGLCLVCKPAFDELWLVELAAAAQAAGDPLLTRLLASLQRDSQWQRRASHALVEFLVRDNPDNARVLSASLARFWGLVRPALAQMASLEIFATYGADKALSAVTASCEAYWGTLQGLSAHDAGPAGGRVGVSHVDSESGHGA